MEILTKIIILKIIKSRKMDGTQKIGIQHRPTTLTDETKEKNQ